MVNRGRWLDPGGCEQLSVLGGRDRQQVPGSRTGCQHGGGITGLKGYGHKAQVRQLEPISQAGREGLATPIRLALVP